MSHVIQVLPICCSLKQGVLEKSANSAFLDNGLYACHLDKYLWRI